MDGYIEEGKKVARRAVGARGGWVRTKGAPSE